jgi:hypothetical protein
MDDLLEHWLQQVSDRGFLWHSFRSDRHGPDYLAAVLARPDVADVLVISGDEYAHAYRTPRGDSSDDVFRPKLVWWWYGTNPIWVVRALLALPEPRHPDAPHHLMNIPAPTGVPGALRPVRIQPGRRIHVPSGHG